jgi:hypothetical protein
VGEGGRGEPHAGTQSARAAADRGERLLEALALRTGSQVTATQRQLDLLEDAIARGARSYEYDGKRVDYRSLQEMFAVRKFLRAQLGFQDGDGVEIVRYDKGTRPLPYMPSPGSDRMV